MCSLAALHHFAVSLCHPQCSFNVPAEGTSSSTLDQALLAANGALPNGTAHRQEHPFSSTPMQTQQQALCLLYGGFTGGGVEGTLLAVDAGALAGSKLIAACWGLRRHFSPADYASKTG